MLTPEGQFGTDHQRIVGAGDSRPAGAAVEVAAVIECEAEPFIKVIGARRAQTCRIVAERNVVKFSVGICPRITGKNLPLGSRLVLRTGRGAYQQQSRSDRQYGEAAFHSM